MKGALYEQHAANNPSAESAESTESTNGPREWCKASTPVPIATETQNMSALYSKKAEPGLGDVSSLVGTKLSVEGFRPR